MKFIIFIWIEPVVKPGTCPPNSNPDVACIAIPRPGDCSGDQSCPGKQKCCNQGCGHICQDPGMLLPPLRVCNYLPWESSFSIYGSNPDCSMMSVSLVKF